MHDTRHRKPLVVPTNSNTRLATGRLQRSPNRVVVMPQPAQPRPTNSNTRMSVGLPQAVPAKPPSADAQSAGIAVERMRDLMVERLRGEGMRDEIVLAAMRRFPRHAFVDEALASRAYENAALPIGWGQTISQPRIVAHMIATVRNGRELGRVLEVGTGCGYQAAVLAGVAREVYSMERIRGLYEQARSRLRALRLPQVHLVLGDGMRGWPAQAPFDAIIVAAAGLEIPPALVEQLAPGGRLLAPVGGNSQRLVLIERTGARCKRTELDPVRFVPLQSGVQL